MANKNPEQLHAKTPEQYAIEMLGQAVDKLADKVRALENRTAYPIQDGTAGTPAGTVVIGNYGKQVDGTVSLTIADKNGVKRVVAGQMPKASAYAGDVGILLQNTDGTEQELLPVVSAYNVGTFIVNSTSAVFPAGTPSVVATIGASGDSIVDMWSIIETDIGTGVNGGLFLKIDSTTYTIPEAIVNGVAGLTVQMPIPYSLQTSQYSTIGHLTPGPHTFTMGYAVATGYTCIFSACRLQVQPI